MLFYWSIFALFALGALLSGRSVRDQARLQPFLVLCATILAAMIGLRYRVGADWGPYLEIFAYSGRAPLADALSVAEDGFILLNRAFWRAGWDIWTVNLVCATFFSVGLYRFAKWQPDRWLAYVVAVPYLIIVVAMGYTRQAAAIGFLLLGMTSLFQTGSILRMSAWIVAGTFFHSSILIILPLLLLAVRERVALAVVVVTILGFLAYKFLLTEVVDTYLFRYVDLKQQSSGALIRMMMNVVPAVIFLLFGHRMQFAPLEANVWRAFSILTLALTAALLVSPSTSTGIDRTALYLIPIQLAVMCRAPRLFRDERVGTALVIGYCALTQFVWLNFGVFSSYWVPYRLFPI